MFGEYSNIAIRGIASVVPKRNIENLQCENEELSIKKLKKQIKYTGVERRRILSEKQTASDLATLAAETLIKELGWSRNSIKVIVYITQSPDLDIPSTALVIQKRLGIGKDCMAFDVNLGCSGYTAGIQIVAGLIHLTGGRALLLTSDGMRKRKRQEDYLLFGHAGTATAIETENGNRLCYRQQSDGTRFRTIIREHGKETEMDGTAVFAFTINDVSKSIKETKDYFSIAENTIDYYVFHQGQKMIVDNLAEICDISASKLLYSLRDYGNTSSSSIPLSICNEEMKLKEKEIVKLYLCGFGVGLSWGSVILNMDTGHIMKIEESDYHYCD